MIKEVIDILNSGDFYNVSEEVEIAKGKNKIATTFKQGLNKINRAWRLSKK